MNYYDHYSKQMKEAMVMRSRHNIWYMYNGINEGLINDGLRNQFYNNILKECEGKRCVDVGSGSGLLAFLALKNGAKHVTCIEQNLNSCNHIQTVAQKMGISDDRIRVINDEFKSSHLSKYEIYDPEIIFHEIIGGSIWDEMLRPSFDVHLPNIKILPERYELRFSIVVLEEEGLKKIIDHHCGFKPNNKIKLNPYVDIDKEYIEYYTEVIQEKSLYDIIKPLRIKSLTRKLFNQFYLNSSPFKKYSLDINDKVFYSIKGFSFDLPQLDKPYLLFIHPFLHSGNYTLDTNNTAFNGLYEPILVPKNNFLFSDKKFQFDILNGMMMINNHCVF